VFKWISAILFLIGIGSIFAVFTGSWSYNTSVTGTSAVILNLASAAVAWFLGWIAFMVHRWVQIRKLMRGKDADKIDWDSLNV
jgi:hypothetical protein